MTAKHMLAIAVIALGMNLGSSVQHEHEIYFDENSVILQKGSINFVDLVLHKQLEEDAIVDIWFYDQDTYINSSNGVIKNPSYVIFKANYNQTVQVKGVPIIATEIGEVTMVLRSASPELNALPNFNHTFVVVDVIHSDFLKTFNDVLGWSYMICWGCSYYPQFFENFKNWNVEGFSIDYGLLNTLAYFSYCVVTCSMFWDPYIRSIYFKEHPHTQIPVEIPDLASVLHNMVIISLLGLQCVFLPRCGQRLTIMSYVCSACFVLMPLFALPFAATNYINWLEYVHVFSYIKIGISLVKYGPQAWLNFKRKSTDGYSPFNVTLDFAGSTFLVLQLSLLSANRSDIYTLIGNPAKLGVGFFSWIFTGIFMVQKFILYWRNDCAIAAARRAGYEPILRGGVYLRPSSAQLIVPIGDRENDGEDGIGSIQ